MTWKPINTAPIHETFRIGRAAWGPMIRLRDATHETKGHWRHQMFGYDVKFDQSLVRPGRWEDDMDQPLSFAPQEWNTIDG